MRFNVVTPTGHLKAWNVSAEEAADCVRNIVRDGRGRVSSSDYDVQPIPPCDLSWASASRVHEEHLAEVEAIETRAMKDAGV